MMRMENSVNPPRNLEWWERQLLEKQGCRAENWDNVRIASGSDLSLISYLEFAGCVEIGELRRDDKSPDAEICHARLKNCTIGRGVTIRNIGVKIEGYAIGDYVKIENTGELLYELEAPCGVGLQINVLDETGSRPVTIYPGLSAQVAELMARLPRWAESSFRPILDMHLEHCQLGGRIGNHVKIINTGSIRNVFVGDEVEIVGASMLENGAIVNNAAPGKCLSFVGTNVMASNFIVEDGVLDTGATVENAYIGQGARLAKGFSAHDSLFFANSVCENGEGCALFAGPYTTTMHKSTLLIGALTQFMNAGSGSNQSNHLYKMGPVHWGIMQRGVKTSSGSYVMWGAKIGAFSLLVGSHKMHPDTSDFPFSYLFGDERGGTIVVPGIMLRSSGLLRDEKKWPLRERRAKRKLPLHDRICFEVLNPVTVGAMLRALPLIDELRRRPADDDRFVRFKGMKLRVSNLERAHRLYTLGICKYIVGKLGEASFPEAESDASADEWLDLSGQFLTKECLERVLQASSVSEMERLLTECFDNYSSLEMRWIATALAEWGKKPKGELLANANEFDRLMEEDRKSYLQDIADENSMLALL